MNFSCSIYKNRTLLTFAVVILLCVLCATLRGVTAQSQLKLTLDPPSPLNGKGKITVADPANATRQFDPSKFKPITQSTAGIVSVTPPTQNDGVFEVTPLKSGATTLTIRYEDGQTVLQGSINVVVPYTEARLQVPQKGEPLKKDEILKLVSGQSIVPTIMGKDFKTQELRQVQSILTSNNPDVVSSSNDKTKLIAQNVTGMADASISVKVDDVPYDPIKVQVIEAIDRIEVISDGVTINKKLPVPEGDTKNLTVKIVGVNGTVYKPSDFPTLNITIGDPEPAVAPFFIKAKRDGDNLQLTTNNLPLGTPLGKQDLILKIQGRGKVDPATGSPTDVTTTIEVSVIQKAGAIKLTSSSPTLIQGGRVVINAVVVGRSGGAVIPSPDVTFSLEKPTDSLWVTLLQSGNEATLVWKNPTDEEIKAANNNQVVPRPQDVVVVATSRLTADSPEITGKIAIEMGEIQGFDFLKIKLNIMDARTATDLYGKVTSDEYYVLTVRLFNDLKDEKTQQGTGKSILAYSSSIEVAVGLEKRFNPGRDSFFPSVISKSEADRLAKLRAEKAAELANTRINNEVTAAQNAQSALMTAINEQYSARQTAINFVNTAIEKKVVAEKSIEHARLTQSKADQNAANIAINDYNTAFISADAALEKARDAEDKVEKLRAAAARAAADRAILNPDISTYFDPSIAINDYKWHPASKYDLNRIMPPPEPTPTPDANGLGLLPPLTDAGLRAMPTQTPTPTPPPSPSPSPAEDEDRQDPPCVGVVTYRPFTFEMMVNTVDRREERSTRSKVFRILDFIGTGTSFVTSVAIPGPSSDLPLGLEKYRNLLIPGLDKLYPNYKEQQRQNIVSQAMKEIEEIPFGSDITRVIFIPKKTIHGLIRGHDVCISEICPYFFKIRVAIVTKQGVVQQGTIAQ